MTVYADINYYWNTFQGDKAVTASHFREASQLIDLYTLDRIDADNVPEDVKMCCCELAETLLKFDTLEGCLFSTEGKVVSDKVGDLSASYAYNTPDLGDFNKKKGDDVRGVIERWLAGTGLLYRGVSG